jgi:hypothetical protein
LREKPSESRLDELTTQNQNRIQLFYTYIHISYRLCIGLEWVVKCTDRMLSPTFYWIFRQDSDQSFYKYGPRGTCGYIMSRAFVFLKCDVDAERAILVEMRHITWVSQTIALQSLYDGFWQPCFKENLTCCLRSR